MITMRPKPTFINKNKSHAEKTKDLMKSCRLCLNIDTQMMEIFDVLHDIDKQILFCIGIQVTKDNLPSQICVRCFNDLQTAHQLKKSSLRADSCFRKLLRVNHRPKVHITNGNDGGKNNGFNHRGDTNEGMELMVETEKETVQSESEQRLSHNIIHTDSDSSGRQDCLTRRIVVNGKTNNHEDVGIKLKEKSKVQIPKNPESRIVINDSNKVGSNGTTHQAKPKVQRLINPESRIVGSNGTNGLKIAPVKKLKPTPKLIRPAQRIIIGGHIETRIKVTSEPNKIKSVLENLEVTIVSEDEQEVGRTCEVSEGAEVNTQVTTDIQQESSLQGIKEHSTQLICELGLGAGHICEVCGKWWPNNTAFYKHKLSHKEPLFECDHCEYKTKSKSDLRKHIYIHMGLKPFSCPHCPAQHRTGSNLSKHVKQKHLRLRPHACRLCGKAFFDHRYLKKHLDWHYQIERYACELCKAKFSDRQNWKNHMSRVHGVTIPRQKQGRVGVYN